MDQDEKSERKPVRAPGSLLIGSAPQVLVYIEGEEARATRLGGEAPIKTSSRLLAGAASKKLERKDVASIIQNDVKGLILFLLLASVCIMLTAASISLLYFELVTGALITIMGEVVYPGLPTHYNYALDPLFFAITTGFGVLLTAAFAWLAIKRTSKIKLARRIEERFRKPEKLK